MVSDQLRRHIHDYIVAHGHPPDELMVSEQEFRELKCEAESLGTYPTPPDEIVLPRFCDIPLKVE